MQLDVSRALALRQSGGWQQRAYPESEVGKAFGQAGQRLEAGAGLGHESQRRRGTGKVSAGMLDATGLARLVLEGAGRWGSEAAALGRAGGVRAKGTLRAPAGGRAGQH